MRRKSISVLVLTFSVICFLGVIFQSCKHDPQGLDQLDTICYNTMVAPMLVAQCSKCHGASDPKGDLVIDGEFNNVIKLVKPGDPWASELYNIVSSPNNPNMMPPNKPLSKNQLTILEVWIAQGAKNTICSPTN